MIHLRSLVITAFLTGCIVETSGPRPATGDPAQVLDQRVSLARQYIGAGDWENAKCNLELAAAIDSGNADVLEAYAWFITAQVNSNSPSPISKKRLMPVPDREHASIAWHFYAPRVITSQRQWLFGK